MVRVVGFLVLAGCTPDVGGALRAMTDGRSGLADRPLAEGSIHVVGLPGTTLAGLEVRSDDPDVLAPAAPSDLEDTASESDPLVVDDEHDHTWLVLQSGSSGVATILLVDPATDEVVDEVEVEVAAVHRRELRPAWAWRSDETLPARVVAGLPHTFTQLVFDADGRELARSDPWAQRLVLPASSPGTATLAGSSVEVVDPAALVGVELLDVHADRGVEGVLVVGLTDDGGRVVGVDARWTGGGLPGDARGDVLAYLPGPGAIPVEVRVGDHVASTVVASADPVEVAWSDQPLGCDTSGAASAWGAAFAAGIAARRRRR